MSSRSRRAASTLLALGVVALMTAACAPEPAPSASGSVSASPTASPSSSPSTTPAPDESFGFPASCDDLYSPEMRATLEADVPPLNDAGTTMVSTENAEALEALGAATQTIRCSWGPPSERGLATNVTAVTAEQRESLATAFAQNGFSTEDVDGGTLHRIAQEVITLDDELVTKGEIHYLRDGVWVSTRWINVEPEGYTEDIIASLWG
ncbi:hypothetical protein QL996_06345 [Planococcus sp. APC 4015]|nr:hypothetical protein [Planococcus sp. APC 4015]